jgi:hypothetical protein
MSEPTPLPAELKALLEVERERADLPVDATARLAARLTQSLDLASPLDAGPAAAAMSGVSSAGQGAVGSGLAPAASAGWLLPAVAAFVAGAVAGSAVTYWSTRAPAVNEPPPPSAVPRAVTTPGLEPPRPVVVTPEAAPPPPADAPAESGAIPPASRDSAAPPPATGDSRPTQPAPGTSASARSDRELAAERELLERARTALARARGADALSALDEHARTFRRGRLAEERESLRVATLIALGRAAEARAAAERFSKRHPNSLFGPAVQEMVRSLPSE